MIRFAASVAFAAALLISVPQGFSQPEAAPGEAAATPAAGKFPVRFRVEAPGADKVFLAGSFNSWDPAALQMTRDGARFSAVVSLAPGEHTYKFVINGTEWKPDPANPAGQDDGVGGLNSVVRVTPDGRVMIPGGEDAVPASLLIEPAGPGKSKVTFTFHAPAAEKVYLAGSFNHWNPTKDEMEKRGEVFTKTLVLEDGEYHYKFVINGTEWRQDPLNPEGVDDNNQGQNSLLRLGPAANVKKSTERTGDGRINEAGLFHDPETIEYFNPLGDGTAVVKVRAMAGDLTSASVIRQSAELRETRGMRSEFKDDKFETYSTRIGVRTSVPRAHGGKVAADYTFVIEDSDSVKKPVRLVLGKDGATSSPSKALNYAGRRATSDIFLTPKWARDVVWYEIFPERFRNGSKENDPKRTADTTLREWTSDWWERGPNETGTAMEPGVFGRRYGGDLQGVIEKLPYLKELGVGAIWFNPVFEAESLHKYDATDYRHIDDNFGTAGDYEKALAQEDLLDPKSWVWTESDKLFLDLVKKSHDAGIKVIVDGVFNHTGTEHPAFQDLLKNGKNSRFAEWYNVESWEPFKYEGWGGFGGLPVFKEDADGFAVDSLEQHLREVTRRWMDPNGDGDPSDGIDGWRLDVPNEVSADWWREWRDLVKSINPDAIIIGEIWDPPARWLKGDQFDSVMNYQMAQALSKFYTNRGKASDLRQDFAKLLHTVPVQANEVMMNLMNSHDTDRLISQMFNPGRGYDARNRQQDVQPGEYKSEKPTPETYQRMKALTGVQFAYVGSPMIYYGDEAGMWGADDPEDRKPMIWKDLEPYTKPEENFFMADVHAHFQRLGAIRNTLPALQTGEYEALAADDAARTFAFKRFTDKQTVVVVTNDSEQVREVTVSLGAVAPKSFVDLVHDPAVKVVPGTMKKDSRTRVEIGPGATAIPVKQRNLAVQVKPYSTSILVGR